MPSSSLQKLAVCGESRARPHEKTSGHDLQGSMWAAIVRSMPRQGRVEREQLGQKIKDGRETERERERGREGVEGGEG